MSKNRVLPLLLLPLLAAAAGSVWAQADGDDPLAAVRSRGVLEVALYAEFPPYSAAAAGKAASGATGIDVELARALAQRLGLPLKLRLINAGETVSDDLRNHIWKGHYLGGGVADVMLHVGFDQTFARKESNVWFLAPYFHESIAIAYKPSRIPHLESPIALTEHKIAVEADTISAAILNTGYGGALRTAAVRKLSLEEAVAAFRDGEVDGVMGPRAELQGLLVAQGVSDVQFHTQEPVGMMHTEWDLGVAVRNAGNTDLRDAVAVAMSGLMADGTVRGIFAAHGIAYVAPSAGSGAAMPASTAH